MSVTQVGTCIPFILNVIAFNSILVEQPFQKKLIRPLDMSESLFKAALRD